MIIKNLVYALLGGMTTISAVQAQNISDSTRIKSYTIDEVVVTGTNYATGRSLLPYTVSTIGSTQLEATGNNQLLSAISAQVPSLFVSERNIFGFGVSSGGSGGIKIRGVGGSPTNAILMMVDGQPQFAGIYSHHVADSYETEYVDHVEVLRGPASVLYGSNAMGGVINVITKNADKDGVYTTLSSQYGSYNTWRSSLTNTTRFGKFSSLVSLGYDRTDGLQDNFDFKQGSLYAKLGYDFSDAWKARVDYSLMNFIGNDPIYPKLSNPTSTDIYHQNITRGEASLSLNNNYGRTNDYSGLNSLRSRLQGIQWPDNSLSGDSIQGKSPTENYKSGSSFGYQSSLQGYLSELSKGKSCIGAPIFFFFELGTNHLTDASQLVNLDEIARIAKQYNLSIRICGAADSATGTSDINHSLGASRSEYIYSQLLHRGMDRNRISEVNKGGIDAYAPKEANRHTSVMLFFK